MTIANVTLTNTFDEWRVRTNQLISLYDETNQLSRIAYNATNNFVSTTANLTANIIVSNTIVYDTIYTNANSLTAVIIANLASFVTTEATVTRAIANLAYDTANNAVDNIAYSVGVVLASNTTIQNSVNASVTQLFVDYLANNDLTYVGTISNSAFSTANSAYDRANTAGGGYFAGNNGYVGNANNKADIFRINTNTFTGNIVFSAGENASATGPLYMDANSYIQIQTGARVVII